MTFIRTILFALVAALGTTYLAGCASSDTRRPTGQVIDDASITTRVKTALAKETGLGGAMDVNVTTNRGIVQLSGFVNSRDLADRAGQVARSVNGVQSVKNDIQVAAQGPRPSASTGTSNARDRQ